MTDDDGTVEIEGRALGPVDLATDAVELAREQGSDTLLAEALGTLAWCLRRAGDLEAAEAVIPEIRDIDKRTGHDAGRADAVAFDIARARGESVRAAGHLAARTRKFRSRREHEKLVPEVAGLVAEWAELAVGLGRPEEAARLLGAVEGILERNAARIPRREFDPERIATALTEELGDGPVERLRVAGRRMSARQALEEVASFAAAWDEG